MSKFTTWRGVLGAVLGCLAAAHPAHAGGTFTVGDQNSPDSLQAALYNAYSSGSTIAGVTTININPGTYKLGVISGPPYNNGPFFVLNGWSNTIINGTGVTIIYKYTSYHSDVFQLNNCNNVTIQGITVTQQGITVNQDAPCAYQGRVTGYGPILANGHQTLNVVWDAGYPVPPVSVNGSVQWLLGADGASKTQKQGGTDYYNSIITNAGGGVYQIDFGSPTVPMVPGDYIWGRYGDPYCKFDLRNSGNCTLKNVTMYRGGYSSIFDYRATAANHYLNVIWGTGPAPTGATAVPIVASASDGIDAIGGAVGPDIQNCSFQGIIGDDAIATYSEGAVVNASSNGVLTVDIQNSRLALNAPVVVSGDHFSVRGTIATMQLISGNTYSITLNQNFNVPVNAQIYNANYMCSGYKILNSSIGHSRSHGIIATSSDNGLIQGNTFFDCTGPEVYVGNESRNIQILNNKFTNSQGGSWPACFVSSTGVVGNANITINNNLFTNCGNDQISVNGTATANVIGNTFISPFQLPGAIGREVSIFNSSGVKVSGNLTTNRGTHSYPVVANADGLSPNATGLTNGVFTLDSLFGFQLKSDGLVLDNPGGGVGAVLDQATYTGSANQQWSLTAAPSAPGYFTMTNGASNLYAGATSSAISTPDTMQNQSVTGGVPAPAQLWTMPTIDATYVNLVNNQSPGYAINVVNGSTAPGAPLNQYTAGDLINQDWAPFTMAYTGAVPFTTGLETGQTQPTWSDSVYGSANVGPITNAISPECGIRTEGVAHTGSTALMFSGNATGASPSYCYYKVFSTSIPITATTQLSYWILPQSYNSKGNARYVAVDFICTDGTTLRDSGALDWNGFSVHPGAGHGVSSGYAIPLDRWSQVGCKIGKWLAGKTVSMILVGYDNTGGSGPYRGYIDDLTITNGQLPQPTPSALGIGGALTVNQYISSPSRNCFLIQQNDGYLALYQGSGPTNQGALIWRSAITPATDTYFTKMQNDGNLVTYAGTPASPRDVVWSSVTYGHNYAYLQVTDAMQVQVTDGASALWSKPSTMPVGGFLSLGQYITSPSGNCYLTQQSDGNLVLYSGSGPRNSNGAIISTGFGSKRDDYFAGFAANGNFFTAPGTLATPGVSVWNAGVSGTGNVLKVTDGQQAQVLSSAGAVLWHMP